MEKTRALRVLHIIDTLGGGGSERLVWDIVRLSDPARVQHRVVTIFREGYLATPVYAERLRQLGAYGKPAIKEELSRKGAKTQSEQQDSQIPFASLRLCGRILIYTGK